MHNMHDNVPRRAMTIISCRILFLLMLDYSISCRCVRDARKGIGEELTEIEADKVQCMTENASCKFRHRRRTYGYAQVPRLLRSATRFKWIR